VTNQGGELLILEEYWKMLILLLIMLH
jgi:hypothetical protein